MGLLKIRKNKKFDYQPRFYDNNGENPYEIKSTFDEFRKSTKNNKGLKTKFVNAIDELKEPQDKRSVRIMLIVIAILLLAFLFFIEFDLSIFIPEK